MKLKKAGLVVKYKLDSSSGSLKDANLFRRFFVCMNFEARNDSNNQNEQGNLVKNVKMFFIYRNA